MADSIPTVLENIVAARRTHLAGIRERVGHVEKLEPSTRSLYENLRRGGRGGGAFIMECKSASPSLGLIRAAYNPGEIARVYSRYAAGISVLCEPERFGGDYDHLATVAATTHLPVLCKDFIIDPVQIKAARHYGADAILLMLSILSDDDYAALAAEAARWDLDVLTEVITEEEVTRAIRLGAKILGINNRNLHDLSIDLSRTPQLSAVIPPDVVVISESGIRDNETVRNLKPYANGFLMGSQLTSQPDVDLAARELVYGTNKVCGLTSPAAAQAARAMGATYGGLIFEEASPRNVSRETSEKIIAAEPGLRFVAVSRRTENWADLVQPGIVALQVHSPYQGSQAAEKALIDSVRAVAGDTEVWRAVSMTTDVGVEWALGVAEHVDKLVLDAGDGGSGTTFQWQDIPAELKATTLLAGGINNDNLPAALATGTLGLDMNSGFEYAPSKKDTGALAEAFATIRNFYYEKPNERTTA